METITAAAVAAWVGRYEHAWRTNDPTDIGALFAADGEYHEEPYPAHWLGRDAIVEGWRGRWGWQQGGWEFTWTLRAIDGATATIDGTGTYAELGVFDNQWTVTFDGEGRCTRFHMINNERAG